MIADVRKQNTPEWQMLHEIADMMGGQMRLLFEEAFMGARDRISYAELGRALEAGDAEGVIRAVPWQQIFDDLAKQLVVNYRLGIERAADESIKFLPIGELPPGTTATFDVLDPRVVESMRNRSSNLVVEINDSTKETLRAAMTRAIERGENPRRAARRLREMIGLTERQARAADNYLARQLMDGNITVAQAERRAERYRKELLRQRTENIARTESIWAANEGQQMMWEQLDREGTIDASAMEREWMVTPDDRLCDLCEGMDGQKVPINEPFIGPRGQVDHPPLHPQCRCAAQLKRKVDTYAQKPAAQPPMRPMRRPPPPSPSSPPGGSSGLPTQREIAERLGAPADPEARKDDRTFRPLSRSDADLFAASLKNLGPGKSDFVTQYPVEELQKKIDEGARLYLNPNGAGYMLDPENDLQAVHNSGDVRGLGSDAVRDAVMNGAATLDAYDVPEEIAGVNLPKLYGRFGFREYDRMEWSDEYAPPGWDYDKYGRPDVVMMRHVGWEPRGVPDAMKSSLTDPEARQWVQQFTANPSEAHFYTEAVREQPEDPAGWVRAVSGREQGEFTLNVGRNVQREALRPLGEDITLYRGWAQARDEVTDPRKMIGSKIAVGKDGSMASTSLDGDFSRGWANFAAEGQRPVFVQIQAEETDRGARVLEHSFIPSQREVILPAGTKLDIIGAREGPQGELDLLATLDQSEAWEPK